MDQQLPTMPQHQSVRKILGYDFNIVFKLGKQSMVANALSRRSLMEPSLLAISEINFLIFEKIRDEILESDNRSNLVADILNRCQRTLWSFTNGLILYNKRVHITPSSPLIDIWYASCHPWCCTSCGTSSEFGHSRQDMGGYIYRFRRGTTQSRRQISHPQGGGPPIKYAHFIPLKSNSGSELLYINFQITWITSFYCLW